MVRFIFVVLIPLFSLGQEKLPGILTAEKLLATNPQKAAAIAKNVFTASQAKSDYYNTAYSSLILSKVQRQAGYYFQALYYDSIALLHARRQSDVLLRQKATNSYIRNFVEQLLVPKAESLLEANQSLFTDNPTAETCTWYEMKAMCYFNRMQFDSAILTCRTAQPIALQLQDSTILMHLQMLIGKFYITTFRPDSVRILYNALRYFEQKENYRYAAQAANIIGFSFETVNFPDKALIIYEKALGYYNRLNDAREAMQTRMHMGDAYLAKKEPERAKASFLYGYRYFSGSRSRKEICNIAIRLGKIYTDEARFDSAWYYFKITEAINQQLQSPVTTMGLNVWKAQLLSRQSRYKEADSLMEAGIQMALQVKAELPILVIEKRLTDKKTITTKDTASDNRFAKLRSATPQPVGPTSGEDYRRMERLNWHTGGNGDTDSTDLEKSQRMVIQVEAEHHIPVLKDSLHEERKSRGVAQTSLIRNRLVATGIIVILLAGATILFVYYRKRHSAERERIQVQSEDSKMEVHHRVDNQLSTVHRMVDIAGKNEAAKLSVAVLKNRIHSITLVHRLLYTTETGVNTINLQTYFSELCSSIASIFGAEQSVHINICAPVEVKATLAEKLGLIVNELVTNSFKYAFTNKEQGTIRVYAKAVKHQLYLTVSDDGCGLPAGNRKKGHGTKFIIGTTNGLKGNYSYRNEGGTFFELTIPINV